MVKELMRRGLTEPEEAPPAVVERRNPDHLSVGVQKVLLGQYFCSGLRPRPESLDGEECLECSCVTISRYRSGSSRAEEKLSGLFESFSVGRAANIVTQNIHS